MSEDELKILSHFKEQICRNNCEKKGTCYDCYIEFEEVKAVEHLLNEYEKLQQENEELKNKIDKAIEYIGRANLILRGEDGE
jgi:hypothetical protein